MYVGDDNIPQISCTRPSGCPFAEKFNRLLKELWPKSTGWSDDPTANKADRCNCFECTEIRKINRWLKSVKAAQRLSK